eukprot:gene33198-40166_t
MSSPTPYPPAPPGSAPTSQAGLVTPIDHVQPIVRVMRLYKPGLHMTNTIPYFHGRNNPLPPHMHDESLPSILSNFLLLPDSFGDIYLGERFTGYIAVLNGLQHVTFQNVTLNVRLQTTTSVIELPDTRPSATSSSSLAHNETKEVVVSQLLTELGTHTLRVSVQYTSPYHPEVKTLRKFYRFNVLQPLMVLSTYLEVGQLPMVQGQLTNNTKAPIFIEEINFVSKNTDAAWTALHSPTNILDPSAPLALDDIILVQPEESYAFAFQCTAHHLQLADKSVGYPLIRWSNSFGEQGVYRGEDAFIKPPHTPLSLLPQPIKGILLSAPATVEEGSRFEVKLRLINTSNAPFPASLSLRNLSIPSASPSNANAAARSSDERLSLSAPGVNFTPHSPKGLVFVGLTSYYLGVIEGGNDDGVDVTVHLVAANGGLYDIPPIGVINAVTKERYYISNLCKVLVREDGVEAVEDLQAVRGGEVLVGV